MTNEEAQEHIAAELQDLALEEPLLKPFAFLHLPKPLRLVSAHFAQIAIVTATAVPANHHRADALARLNESKACAILAMQTAEGRVQ